MDLFDIAVAKKLAGGGGGGATIEALSVTENGTYTAPSGVDGYSPITVNVSGGGGGGGLGTLLASKSLGTVNSSSTSETLVDSITISNATQYDVFFAIVKGDSIVNSRHYATASFGYLYDTSDRAGEDAGTSGFSVANRWNCIATSNGRLKTSQSGRGIYISNVVRSNQDITIKISVIYNSTQTGTINNDYSVEIYGINLYELITS